jgi:hypothetical protein
MPPSLTPKQQQLLEAVRQAADNEYRSATIAQIRAKLGRMPSMAELRELYERGQVMVQQRKNKTRGNPFTAWAPRAADLAVFPADIASVRARLEDVVDAERGSYPAALYPKVREHFSWFDDEGNDLLRPVVEQLAQEGFCQLTRSKNDKVDLVGVDGVAAVTADPVLAEPADPTDRDFEVLNQLEDDEARQINFGAYETVHTVGQVAQLVNRPEAEVRASLKRLLDHRYLVVVGQKVFRSRMAELARLLRYLKQRFGPEDAGARPFVVRSLQVRARDRKKPPRNRDLAPTLASLKQTLADVAHAAAVLDALEALLRDVWRIPAPKPVTLAAFQLRALEALLPAYLGQTAADTFVITADTGAGKTEAATFPLMAGAALDRLRSRTGVKAVLVYPRIRLAYNQAQRLTGYFASLARQNKALLLTIGLQTGDVPSSFPWYGGDFPDDEKWKKLRQLWPWHAERKGYEFPFFRCPGCGQDLLPLPRCGQGADRLECLSCPWAFDGWVGTKGALAKAPPDFFLPVTESLHQWQHDPDSGALFGDAQGVDPPCALLADEIHLYAHVHGAQVGYALRRFLARAWVNARARDPAARRPLAVGMSATLGEPAAVWGALTGRPGAVTRLAPQGEAETATDPQGREYFYFVQPEVESRGQLIAGESTTIQALMCLAHGMRRRPGDRGGYRGLVFFDSIDSLKRLLDDYRDAEQRKQLARLRTQRYPDDPLTRQPRRQCCGKPAECDLFQQGECWFFAAGNDPYQVAAHQGGAPVRYQVGQPLAVMDRPVYSGSSERVERLIGQNDLVFSTSSLEVGFDDDEMILVYQHYAPVNLASFLQRKGRGGRGIGDRPVTGVTLSIYSPRDAWYFRHPNEMLRAEGFEIPLNPDNFFVRRGQALAALLDALARHCGVHKLPWPAKPTDADLTAMRATLAAAAAEVDAFVRRALGDGIYKELKVKNVLDLWDRAGGEVKGPAAAANWRALLPWIPERLFDAINLPLLTVRYRRRATTPARGRRTWRCCSASAPRATRRGASGCGRSTGCRRRRGPSPPCCPPPRTTKTPSWGRC